MAQIVPIEALRQGKRATEALKGDIYTRSWTSVAGKGKKKKVVEHSVHVNPITAIVAVAGGTIAAGVAAWVGMRTLKQTGYQFTVGPKNMVRVLRVYAETFKTVVDSPAIPARTVATTSPGSYVDSRVWNPITHRYEDISVWEEGKVNYTEEAAVAAVTHQESVGQRAIVFTKKGVPIREWKGDNIALEWPQCLSKRQLTEGWTWQDNMGETSGSDRYGAYRQAAYLFINPKLKGPKLATYTPAEKTSLIDVKIL